MTLDGGEGLPEADLPSVDRVLVRHAGKVLTHVRLMAAVSAASDPPYLRVSRRQFRQTLEADPARPRLLPTETDVGHRLRAPDDRLAR